MYTKLNVITIFYKRAHLYYASFAKTLQVEVKGLGIPLTRGRTIVKMMDSVRSLVMEWVYSG